MRIFNRLRLNMESSEASLQYRVVATFLSIGVPLLVYLLVGACMSDNFTYELEIGLDSYITRSLEWLVPYCFMYTVSFAPSCAVKSQNVLTRWVSSVVLMYLIAIPVWVLYPVAVPRYDIVEHDYFGYLLSIIQSLDPQTNCFPSMHVAVATISGLIVRKVDRAVGTLLLATVPLIWYSTVAVCQHWVIDGAAGLALAFFSYYFMFVRRPCDQSSLDRVSRLCHLMWLGTFIFGLTGLWLVWVGM